MVLLSCNDGFANHIFSVENLRLFSAYTDSSKPWALYIESGNEYLLVKNKPGKQPDISGTMFGGSSAAYILGVLQDPDDPEAISICLSAMYKDGATKTYLIGDREDNSRKSLLVILALPKGKDEVRVITIIEKTAKTLSFNSVVDYTPKVGKVFKTFLEISGFRHGVDLDVTALLGRCDKNAGNAGDEGGYDDYGY